MARLRFRCTQVVRRPGYAFNPQTRKNDPRILTTATLVPAESDDPNHENKSAWADTPGGQLVLSNVDGPAGADLEEGAEYVLELKRA